MWILPSNENCLFYNFHEILRISDSLVIFQFYLFHFGIVFFLLKKRKKKLRKTAMHCYYHMLEFDVYVS